MDGSVRLKEYQERMSAESKILMLWSSRENGRECLASTNRKFMVSDNLA